MSVNQLVDKAAIELARQGIENLKREKDSREPDRGVIDGEDTKWRFGTAPDYTQANYEFMRGKSRNHPEGSLELLVENLVKRWEFEASHKLDFNQWDTVSQTRYECQVNGGTVFSGKEVYKQGNYNWLLSACPKDMYDSDKETFDSSHYLFRNAFTKGFPWEVLEVYSGPPKVTFQWRHWATFDGEFRGQKGDNELVEMFGFAVVLLNEDSKIEKLEIYYKPEKFMQRLMGRTEL